MISQGSHGAVYKAMDLHRSLPVAIKKFKDTSLSKKGEDVMRTFRNEVFCQKRCQEHPNICKILASNHVSRVMVLEFMDTSLRHLVPVSNTLSEAVLRNIAQQVLKGLCHIHNQGQIIHRDIKPDNLLLNKCGNVKICDFGHAYDRARAPCNNNLPDYLVSLCYRPPDMLMNGLAETTDIDIWSLGCTMAELATGKVCFPGRDPLEVLVSIIEVLGAPNEKWVKSLKKGTRSQCGLPSDPEDRLKEAMGRVKVEDKPSLRKWLKTYRPDLSDEFVEFLGAMLQYVPHHRITAEGALRWISRSAVASCGVVANAGRHAMPRMLKPAAILAENARLQIQIQHRMHRHVKELIDTFECTQHQVQMNAFRANLEAQYESDALAAKRAALSKVHLHKELIAFLDGMAEFADCNSTNAVEKVVEQIRRAEREEEAQIEAEGAGEQVRRVPVKKRPATDDGQEDGMKKGRAWEMSIT